jgi:cytidine deaminase
MEKQITIKYSEFDSWKELADSEIKMVEKAYSMCEQAYAPYSNFQVGATVLLSNGEIVSGNNQENIAYPSGLCAERVALFFAGANFPTEKVESVVVVAKGELVPFDKLLSPCGSCRQVLMESEMRQNKNIRVVLVSQNGRTIVFHSILDLLPFAFGN